MTEFLQGLPCLSDSVQTTLQAGYRKDVMVRWQTERETQCSHRCRNVTFRSDAPQGNGSSMP